MGKGGVGVPVPGQNINQLVIKDPKKKNFGMGVWVKFISGGAAINISELACDSKVN